MLISFGYDMTFTCTQPTPMVCLLDVHADRITDIRRQDPLVMAPGVANWSYRDLFGNTCRRFVAPIGDLTISSGGLIEDSGQPDVVRPDAREMPVAELPDDSLVYLMGSRYCETDLLSPIAWALFGSVVPGWNRVQAICDYVNQRLTFGYGFARATRTAYQAHEERVGVCRDFAHLAVALCRCMNIPARYANGYLGDIGVPPDPSPMDFNAWFEVYLEDGWYTFDARHNRPRIGRILVARGRDATDIPLVNSFGPHLLKSFRVRTEEEMAVSV
jgi:transglutaminase-like putative cysteine protease